MNVALILAGGVGNRVGAGIPKQFVEIHGKPVIAYTLQRFQAHQEIDAIELVCVNGYEKKLQTIVDSNGITKVIKIVVGGSDYEHSIMHGVKGLKGIVQDNDIIMIHWAASPFVTDEIITDNIRVCKEKGNAISACPAYLLYGNNDGDHSETVIDRNSFKILSAPHSFKYKNIVNMYKMVEEEKLFDRIEAHTTTLMAELKIPIYFSKGSQCNIKITTKDDLDLFERYINSAK